MGIYIAAGLSLLGAVVSVWSNREHWKRFFE